MDAIDLRFPHAGLDVSTAFCKQPNRPAASGKYSRTAAEGMNVRCYDFNGRARGGIRPGLVKYIATRPGGTRYITQNLNTLVGTGIDDPGGGTVQPSQSGRLVLLVAVSNGNVYTCPAGGSGWTAATNTTGATPPLNATGTIQSAANGQKLYFADGVNKCYYDPSDNTVRTWTPTDGDFPADGDGNLPRLICTWRSRTVMAGILNDPSLIVMTKVSDPLNFNYAGTTSGVQPDGAWAGNVGPQGLTGDVVTALIPYTDDILIIGMDSSIAMFRGDPQYGGQIDSVTSTIGIAWGKAWCMDPAGVIYFFSNRTGIFAFKPGAQPQRISQAIDPLLEDIDTGDNVVNLIWNDRFQTLHVFVTYLTSTMDTTHYTWEARSNAWWKDTFSNNDHNPITCTVFDGNNIDDRVALIGSWDGYVRSISSEATDDDGSAIESEVWIGPFLTKYNDSVMLQEVQGVLAADSNDVNYAVYVGDTAEEALASTAVATGTWTNGRNYNDTVRRAGFAAYIRLSAANEWAMENIRCIVGAQGKVRQRGK